MSQEKYQVLARRYRPQLFAEVVGQEPVVATLKNSLRAQRTAHAYLFAGCRGVGKTTLARLFAKALNCQERTQEQEPCNHCSSCKEITLGQSLDVIEIDGASNRGIDDIRQISETACYAPAKGGYKIYIIDEVHMLTKEAFNALLKTLEEPPERAKFLFATTEPHKVLPTILSRCQRFDLKRIALREISAKLQEIAHLEKRETEEEALYLIASFAEGSLRDAESLFDQLLSFSEGKIEEKTVRALLGLMPMETFFSLDRAFSTADAAHAFTLSETLFSSGKDPAHFISQLIEHVRLLTITRLSLAPPLPQEQALRYIESAKLYLPGQCLYLLDFLLKQELQLQKSLVPRTMLEGTLLHYIQSKNRLPIEQLVRRLSELETSLGKVPAEPLRKEEPPPPTLAPLALEPVPLNPFTPVEKVQKEPPPAAKEPIVCNSVRHETLMRFAAIELEGSLGIAKK